MFFIFAAMSKLLLELRDSNPYLAPALYLFFCAVMMDAYALELHAAAVQEEALISVKTEGTDSDLSFIYLIGRLAVDGKLGDERIKSRELGGPELGILHAAV